MTTDEFHSYVGRLIKGYLPEGYSRAKAVIKEVDQPGAKPVKALTLMRDGGPVGSTVVLEPYAAALRRGQSMETIMEEIAAACLTKNKKKKIQRLFRKTPAVQHLHSYARMRPHLSTRLFDPETHSEYRKNRPWFQLGDWGLYIEVTVVDPRGDLRTVPVSHDLLRNWHVSRQVLYRDAVSAQSAAHPPWLSIYTGPEEPETIGSNLLTSSVPWRLTQADLFVLSNQERRYGAAVAGWTDVLDRVASVLGRNFALLPTSVHELMIVPDLGLYSHWDLENIVREQRADLAEDKKRELFSDKVVWYDRSRHQLLGKAERRSREVSQLLDEPRPAGIPSTLNPIITAPVGRPAPPRPAH